MCHTSAPPPSSTLTTLRALFMLACLVAIPAVALRGTALGGMLRRFLVEKLDKPAERSSARADLEDAPPFVSPATGLSSPDDEPAGRRLRSVGQCDWAVARPGGNGPPEDAAPWGPPPGISAPRANNRPPRHRWLPLGGGRKRAPLAAKSGECMGRSPRAERSVVPAEYMDRSGVGPALPRRLPPGVPRRSKARRQRRMNSNPT